jgi:type II restriction/modification system DNA methylase subunit YeeA
MLQLDVTASGAEHHTFRISPLRSHLFDPGKTPLLNKVKFRNFVLQQVIELMSLSRPARGVNHRRGRISYSQLGINQLGAVYEALLSYQGFFAETDLYEVKKAEEAHNVLETAYFVKPEELE